MGRISSVRPPSVCLQTRYKLGLFDEDCSYNKIPFEENDSAGHRQAAREAAAKSMVLLENNGILPWIFQSSPMWA